MFVCLFVCTTGDNGTFVSVAVLTVLVCIGLVVLVCVVVEWGGSLLLYFVVCFIVVCFCVLFVMFSFCVSGFVVGFSETNLSYCQ